MQQRLEGLWKMVSSPHPSSSCSKRLYASILVSPRFSEIVTFVSIRFSKAWYFLYCVHNRLRYPAMASGGQSRTGNMDEAHSSINRSRDRVYPTQTIKPDHIQPKLADEDYEPSDESMCNASEFQLHQHEQKIHSNESPATARDRTVSRKRRLVYANLEVQAGIIVRRAERNRSTQSSITIRDRMHSKSELVYNDPGVDTETVRLRHDIDQYCMGLHEALSTSPEDATES